MSGSAVRNRSGFIATTQDTDHLVSHAFSSNATSKQNSTLVSMKCPKGSYEGCKTFGSS